MKAIKFLMAMTLATVPVMSGFMKSADAAPVFSGQKGSQTSSPTVPVQFNLFYTDRHNQPILDFERKDDKVGVFLGAIEDYNLGFGRLLEKNGELVRNSSGFPIFEIPFTPREKIFDVGNLRAELITESYGSEVLRYTIFGPGEYGQVLQSNQRNIDSYGYHVDKYRAINDLGYILENRLLDETIAIFKNPLIPDDIIGKPLYITAEFDRATVFEPSVTLGVLAALSAGLLVKRKRKQNRTA